MKNKKIVVSLTVILLTSLLALPFIKAQSAQENTSLDEKVKKFLADHAGKWHDLNVPAVDGQTLYDLIIKGNYKSALEIGTSTGYSGIWIAWALSKTGGKLITIEINESRHKTALENFKEAGLSEYIDARLGDAHTLVKELKGPFDFIFSDADKDWYKKYFVDTEPNLIVGGCFAAHNIAPPGQMNGSGQAEFYEYITGLKNYQTTVNSSGAGMSISYKAAAK